MTCQSKPDSFCVGNGLISEFQTLQFLAVKSRAIGLAVDSSWRSRRVTCTQPKANLMVVRKQHLFLFIQCPCLKVVLIFFRRYSPRPLRHTSFFLFMRRGTWYSLHVVFGHHSAQPVGTFYTTLQILEITLTLRFC